MRSLPVADFLINLTAALLSGPWERAALRERGRRSFRGEARWLPALTGRLVKAFPQAPSFTDLQRFLVEDRFLRRARRAHRLEVCELFWFPPRMNPQGPAIHWAVPPLATAGELADWLGVSIGRLDWFADKRRLNSRESQTPLHHYVWRWRRKKRGTPRLLAAPKTRLKQIQRQILDGILAHIPPHEAAHGFRPGRSIRSYAAPHAGQEIVLRFDLRDFFPSIAAPRIRAIFASAGYPREVALLLTGLCTTLAPEELWSTYPSDAPPLEWAVKERHRRRHLPQGAPTSPALANLSAYRLDVRLQGLAESVGARYTRYADDLAFSGGEELARAARRFQVAVTVIAAEEGFDLHLRKSRFMRRGMRQHLASVVVNDHPNLPRDEFDRLKAILHNCARFGPTLQNRDGHTDFRAHLLGRVGQARMLNPSRGEKLMAIFRRIVWANEE